MSPGAVTPQRRASDLILPAPWEEFPLKLASTAFLAREPTYIFIEPRASYRMAMPESRHAGPL